MCSYTEYTPICNADLSIGAAVRILALANIAMHMCSRITHAFKAGEMNMIFVNSYLKKMNFIALRYFKTDIFQGFINFFTEYYSAIFYRTYKMI